MKKGPRKSDFTSWFSKPTGCGPWDPRQTAACFPSHGPQPVGLTPAVPQGKYDSVKGKH